MSEIRCEQIRPADGFAWAMVNYSSSLHIAPVLVPGLRTPLLGLLTRCGLVVRHQAFPAADSLACPACVRAQAEDAPLPTSPREPKSAAALYRLREIDEWKPDGWWWLAYAGAPRIHVSPPSVVVPRQRMACGKRYGRWVMGVNVGERGDWRVCDGCAAAVIAARGEGAERRPTTTTREDEDDE